MSSAPAAPGWHRRIALLRKTGRPSAPWRRRRRRWLGRPGGQAAGVDKASRLQYHTSTARGACAESPCPRGQGNPLNLIRVIPAKGSQVEDADAALLTGAAFLLRHKPDSGMALRMGHSA